MFTKAPVKKNRGSSFVLTFDYLKETASAKWLSRKKKHVVPNFPEHILKAIYSKFKNYNHGIIGKRMKRIIGFTEYRLMKDSDGDDNSIAIIRSCPNYRSENDWFDWVEAEWDEDGILEGQCLMFLDFKMKEMESFDISTTTDSCVNERHQIIGNGECVLIHSINLSEGMDTKRKCAKSSKTSVDESNYVVNKLGKFATMETNYHIVSCQCIRDTAFVLPIGYKRHDETYLPGCATNVYVLNKFKYWHKLFIDYDDDDLVVEGNRRQDNDIDSNDEVYKFES